MLDIEKFLKNQEIKTDEYGRIIIEDKDLLEKINGAVFGGAELIVTDGACGNSNCIC